jgi:hypothetical protein
MITITVETDSGEKFHRVFQGGSFSITGNDTERVARVIGTSSVVTVPKGWNQRRCVVVGLLERTLNDTPENESQIRGIHD